jgi:integrase/recombinase XerD
MCLGDCLTEAKAREFFAKRGKVGGRVPTTAVRAVAHAMVGMGQQLPSWRPPRPERPLGPVVAEFVAYRLRQRGVAIRSSQFDTRVATAFLRMLRSRRRTVGGVRLCDVDAFVHALGRRLAPASVASACSSLRAFLAFLFAAGRCKMDLAGLVIAPRIRRINRPPRALPWADVQRILRSIDVHAGLEARDFAIFLMMATYGMGAGEITGLTLDDIDWPARILRVRRPKTGVVTHLPLLDPVGHALSRYLQNHRPSHARDRTVFVSHRLPHTRLSGSAALAKRLAMYAKRAGVHADFLGTHVFRHTHATRQIEAGSSVKIVSDILGHRRPESTSTYIRGAVGGLRSIGLPVPR